MLRTGEIIRKRFDQEEDHYTRSLDPFSKNRRRGRVKKGIQIEENEEGNVCTRAPPEHLSSPPKYAFRPKDPHFEIDPHDFPAIYASNIRNLDSFRLFSPRASTLASSIASNRTGSPRNATREFLESGLGATSTRGQRRGKEKLAYLLFLLFFFLPLLSLSQ